MNKVLILSTILMAFISQTVIAQFSITHCKTARDKELNYWSVIDEDPLSILVLTSNLRSGNDRLIYLNRYSRKDCDLENSMPLSVPDAPGKVLVFEGVRKVKNHYYLFSSYFDKNEDTNTLYGNPIDRNGKNTGSITPLDVITDVSKKKQGEFGVITSKKQERVMTWRSKNLYVTEKVNFSINVFDAELKPLWKKDVSIPEYTEEELEIKEAIVDEEGNVYLLAWMNLTDEEKKQHKGHYSIFTVLSFAKGTGAMTWHKVPVPATGFYHNTGFDVLDNKEIVLCGLHSIKDSYPSIMCGTYILKFDIGNATPKILKNNIYTEAFLASWIDGSKLQESKELTGYFVQDVRALPGGDVIATYTKSASGLRREDHIIIVKYNATGEAQWERVILKAQPGNNENYRFFSHKTFFDGQNLYFIYNDNPANLATNRLKEVKPVKEYKKSARMVVKSVSLSGDLKTEAWNWSESEPALFAHPDWFELSDSLIYFMPAQDGDCNSPGKECVYFARIGIGK